MASRDWVGGPPGERESSEWLGRPRPKHFEQVDDEGRSIVVRHLQSGLELTIPWSRWLAFMRGDRAAVDHVRDRLGG